MKRLKSNDLVCIRRSRLCLGCREAIKAAAVVPSLRRRQLEILMTIIEFEDLHGYSPCYDEIGERVKVSKTVVFEHIQRLIQAKYISRSPQYRDRSIRIPNWLRAWVKSQMKRHAKLNGGGDSPDRRVTPAE